MNPHQKPQEDVVVTQEDADLEAWFLRRMPDNAAWRGHIARLLAGHRLLGHEAGRRDMREAAGKVALDYIDLFRIIRRAGRKDAAKAKAVHDAYTAARAALPTEPLGGEG